MLRAVTVPALGRGSELRRRRQSGLVPAADRRPRACMAIAKARRKARETLERLLRDRSRQPAGALAAEHRAHDARHLSRRRAAARCASARTSSRRRTRCRASPTWPPRSGSASTAISGGAVLEDLDRDGFLDVMVSAAGFDSPDPRLPEHRRRPLRGADRAGRPRRHHRRPQPGARRLRQRRAGRRARAARRAGWAPIGRFPVSLLRNLGGLALRGRDEGRRSRRRRADPDGGLVRLRRRRLARPRGRAGSRPGAHGALRLAGCSTATATARSPT